MKLCVSARPTLTIGLFEHISSIKFLLNGFFRDRFLETDFCRNKTMTGQNPMRKLVFTRTVALLLLAFGCSAITPLSAQAQSASRMDIGVDYNYVWSNAPPGGCGCFSLNGGNVWAAFNFKRSLGIVAELARPTLSLDRCPPLHAVRASAGRRSTRQRSAGSRQFRPRRFGERFRHDCRQRTRYWPHPAHRLARLRSGLLPDSFR